MSNAYLKNALGPTAQTEQASLHQIQNAAGGYTFAVDDWKRLDRFLVLGSEGGTYYAGERKLTLENAQCVQRLISSDGPRLVQRLTEISLSGRAPKNDPAIFALALAIKHGDAATKAAAYAALPNVCRIGTHLYHFLEMAKAAGIGWGRGYRRAVANWFNQKDTNQLAYQLAKYQSRDGWAAGDAIRLSHPKPRTADHAALYRWATRGYDECAGDGMVLPPLIEAFEEAKGTSDVRRLCALIQQYHLPRECIPTQMLNHPQVWEALLPSMGPEALVRNLGTMTKNGAISPLSDTTTIVTAKLTDVEALKRGRVHPMALLLASKVYNQGHGDKGKSTWTPIPAVTDALDAAFYLAFQVVEPTNKTTLLGIDVSGSMTGNPVMGMPGIDARTAAAAMALVTAATEPRCHIMGFSHQFVDLNITPRMRLAEVIQLMNQMPFGNTDCSLPMLWATQQLPRNVKVESMAVYTDNETYYGKVHPHVALQNYRKASGVQARLAVVAFTATPNTIADPNDAGMLDFVGMDAAGPALMADFFRGEVVRQ